MSDTGQIGCECGTDSACCAGLQEEPINHETSQDLATGFKALGDPHRVAILHLLSGAGEPVFVVDIERHLPLSQSTVSYHLKTLLNAGVIKREPRGKWRYYPVQPARLAELTDALETYTQRLVATST